MARYDYICPVTGEIREITHGMDETPDVISKEGHKMTKMPSIPILAGFDNLGRSVSSKDKK
jgi:predicted nucleic acid-binding Zn ribbon protein